MKKTGEVTLESEFQKLKEVIYINLMILFNNKILHLSSNLVEFLS